MKVQFIITEEGDILKHATSDGHFCQGCAMLDRHCVRAGCTFCEILSCANDYPKADRYAQTATATLEEVEEFLKSLKTKDPEP